MSSEKGTIGYEGWFDLIPGMIRVVQKLEVVSRDVEE